MNRARRLLLLSAFGTASVGFAACSTSDNAAPTPIGGAGTGAQAGTLSGAAGSVAVGGASGSGFGGTSAGSTSIAGTTAGGASAGGTSAGGTSSNGGAGGGAPTGGAFTGNRTPPTCATPTPSPNGMRAGECDYLLQSLDFEDKLGYVSTTADVKTTSYGTAFGLSAINACSPYCYAKNLTVGIDIVGGGAAAQMQGEVIVDFPKTGSGLPITVADMTRNALAWITFDGAAKPAFEIDTQLVIETAGGVIASVETKPFFKPGGNKNPFGPFNITNDYSYGNGSEFKYFAVNGASGFPSAPTNVTGIGFRITAKATAGQEWHGVAYIDHLQIRGPSGGNDPTDAGAYPFGL